MGYRVVTVILATIQLIRPEHGNPPATPGEAIQVKLPVDRTVDATFARSCNDCHSNLTVWPWYTEGLSRLLR